MIVLPKKVTKEIKMKAYVPSLNSFFSRLLQAYGIKGNQNLADKNKINLIEYFYPFSIYLHLATLYNILVLLKEWIKAPSNKSGYSSGFTTLLSFIIWHVTRVHGGELHRFLKDCSTDFKSKISSRKYSISLTIFAFLISVPVLVILALYYVFYTGIKDPDHIQFWFFGNAPPNDEKIQNSLLFVFVFVYISQQTLFPSVLVMYFCVLNIKYTEKVEKLRLELKSKTICGISLSKQSCLHHSLILKLKRHEEIFSFLIFLVLCLVLAMGFTGLALLTQEFLPEFARGFNRFEGTFYLYFSVISIISITYSASMIQSQFLEIRDFYRNKYESIIEENDNLANTIDEKNIKIIKMMYKREIPYLSAWNVVRLDKNFAFSVFGSLLTYGFLILQLQKID